MGFGVCSKWLMKSCGPALRTSFPLKEESWQVPKQEDLSSFPLIFSFPLQPIDSPAEAWAEIRRRSILGCLVQPGATQQSQALSSMQIEALSVQPSHMWKSGCV